MCACVIPVVVSARYRSTIFIRQKVYKWNNGKILVIMDSTIQPRSGLILIFDFWWLTPLSAIFQLCHGDNFEWWKKPEYPERTTDHGQATGKSYHLRLRVECTFIVIYKPDSNPRRIGDRLVWVVKQSIYIMHWATRILDPDWIKSTSKQMPHHNFYCAIFCVQ